MTKQFLGVALCLFMSIAGYSQGAFSGRLADAKTKQPLALATITLYKSADTSILSYKLSKENGEFRFTNLPYNTELLGIITFSGYKVYKKNFVLNEGEHDMNLGEVLLAADSTSLDEVLVVAQRPPMIVKNDTVEFNASSFKMLPNAMVEDLLKKLPGITVDKDGNIMMGGKRVNKILVDGKTFFGDDPKMASRNLPSYVIDKVQVTDDKDELQRNGDDNLNNVGKVINLTFKKGYKKGVFGKAYAGGGGGHNGGRYEAGAIANIFKDTMQLSLLGYSNNLNRPGFSYSDILKTGGMSRNRDVTGNQSISQNNSDYGSGISINGINFGGMSSEGGVSASSGAGFNFNHAPNKKQSFYLQYFFGNVNTDLRQRNLSTITNADTVVTNDENRNGRLNSNVHSVGAGMNLKPDSVTTVQATLNYVLGIQNNHNKNVQTGTSNVLGALNNGNILLQTHNNNQYINQRFTYTRLSKHKKGRKLSFGDLLTYTNNKSGTYTNGSLQYIFPTKYDSLLGQYRNEKVPSLVASVNAFYSEPLAKNWFLRLGAFYQYEQLKNNTQTFDKSGDAYTHLNPGFTSAFDRKSNRGTASAGLEYKYKSLTITPAVRFQYQKFDNVFSYMQKPLVQQIGNILPQLGVVYKTFEINYRRDVILPAYNYLVPVKNNTNPYLVSLGNPKLLPAVQDAVNINYNHYNPKNYLNVWSWASASVTNKDIIQSITMDASGLQTIYPVNANGTKLIQANFGVNKQYKWKNNFSFSWNVGNYSRYKQNLFIYNNQNSIQKNLMVNAWSGLGLNWNDKLEWNSGFNFHYGHLTNTNPLFTGFETFEPNYETEFILRKIKHVIFETQLTYGTNSSRVDPAYRHYILWNAAVNFTMLKDERAVLKISANDILNQSRNVEVYSYQNTVKTTYNNVLGQYFMATFTYNIHAAGAKKKVGGSMWFD